MSAVQELLTPEPGMQLNHFYEIFKASPASPDAQSNLMQDAHDFATRVVAKICGQNGWRLADSQSEDIVQTTMKNAWKGLAKFANQSKFSTWLYQITRNAIIDEFRKPYNHELQLFSWADDTTEAPEDKLIDELDFQARLKRLNPTDCHIAELFFCFKYSALEIATRLGKDTAPIEGKCSKGERWVQNRVAQIKKTMAATAFARPRITSQADIERAYVNNDERYVSLIEIEHAMSVKALNRLVVPFRSDPTDGRAIFPFASEYRTPYGRGRGREIIPFEKCPRAEASNSPISTVSVLKEGRSLLPAEKAA